MILVTFQRARKVDQNRLAEAITAREGLKVPTNIAQTKEILRHTLDLLAEEFAANPAGVVKLLRSRGR